MKKFNEYMMIEEAANFLGVTMNTLRAWEAKGKIKPYRNPINGFRMYKEEELQELLEKLNKKENE